MTQWNLPASIIFIFDLIIHSINIQGGTKMNIIKTPTGIITIDETIKKRTQAEYDELDNQKDSIYLITDSSKKNIIGLYKDGIPINNFPASKIALIPSGA